MNNRNFTVTFGYLSWKSVIQQFHMFNIQFTEAGHLRKIDKNVSTINIFDQPKLNYTSMETSLPTHLSHVNEDWRRRIAASFKRKAFSCAAERFSTVRVQKLIDFHLLCAYFKYNFIFSILSTFNLRDFAIHPIGSWIVNIDLIKWLTVQFL